ncbi:MAG: ABC transporter ATP-binding protein [Patescibacteria group bacterium]|nr:ABC transporter ATP-binding protein [Patescibacteria group bacterium]MDE2015357.1 ABC transporter ATP-binding protein [Patescibacteria group bacterium]MDE2227162.1 ABC transporter ATP-binding protein [Patescibacteria group bacterium]
MPDIIAAENLSKSYGSNKAVDGLNLHIKKGEFFGFLGPNGAGKTTTIRIITGILKPDSGTVAIDGNASGDKQKIAQTIGVIPESRGFYDWMTAVEYLGFFADLYGIAGKEKEGRINSLLTEVDLLKRKHSRIGTYSRGMRQRLGLARALINNPQILFLDEPTLGLDPQGQEDIQLLLKKLNTKGVTVFLSSHLLNEVSNLCSRIGIINNGVLIAEGTVNELREKTKLDKDKTLTDIFLNLTRNN